MGSCWAPDDDLESSRQSLGITDTPGLSHIINALLFKYVNISAVAHTSTSLLLPLLTSHLPMISHLTRSSTKKWWAKKFCETPDSFTSIPVSAGLRLFPGEIKMK